MRRKLQAAQQHGLKPILCVGETADQLDEGLGAVRRRRAARGRPGGRALDARLVIAYDPVWTTMGLVAPPPLSYVSDMVAPHPRHPRQPLLAQSTADESASSTAARSTPATSPTSPPTPALDGVLSGATSTNPENFTTLVQGLQFQLTQYGSEQLRACNRTGSGEPRPPPVAAPALRAYALLPAATPRQASAGAPPDCRPGARRSSSGRASALERGSDTDRVANLVGGTWSFAVSSVAPGARSMRFGHTFARLRAQSLTVGKQCVLSVIRARRLGAWPCGRSPPEGARSELLRAQSDWRLAVAAGSPQPGQAKVGSPTRLVTKRMREANARKVRREEPVQIPAPAGGLRHSRCATQPFFISIWAWMVGGEQETSSCRSVRGPPGQPVYARMAGGLEDAGRGAT